MRSVRNSAPVLRVVQRPQSSSTGSAPPALLGEIYRRYAPYVAAVVLRLSGRSTELDDLVQDVFLEATRGIERALESIAEKVVREAK